MNKISAVFLIVFLTGCASSSGFNRGYLRNSFGQIEKKEVTDNEIEEALKAKPQLSKPFRLAVYTELNSWQVNWTPHDKAELKKLENNLIKEGVVSEIVYLNSSMIEGLENADIRLAAARTGADAILIIQGSGVIDKYNNFLGSTYFLLITPFFVPGTVADGLFMFNASMWDVRNQYLYLSSEAEAQASQTRPAFFIEEKHILQDAKSEAIKKLRQDIESRLLKMK